MKKKKLFLLASVAALAMTSCSSFDEPAALDGKGMPLTRAGERAQTVTSVAELKRAVRSQEPEIVIGANFTMTEALQLNYPVTISGTEGVTLTTKAPIVCTGDSVKINNITIDATTSVGQGAINLEAEDIVVELDGVNITQHTAGTKDDANFEGLGILNVTCNNTLKLNNTTINLPSNRYVRGISMFTAQTTSVNLEIKGSHITCGTDLTTPSTYARALSFGNVNCDNLVIDNSTLEGAYYVVNVTGTAKVTANVTNGSVLDGRAAFNIWAPNFTAVIDGSTLIGRNNFAGPTETFATIVLNNNGSVMATGSNISLKDVTFQMFTKNLGTGATNIQYAISYRASNQTLKLDGKIKVIDPEQTEISSYVVKSSGVTNVNVTEGATYDYINEDNEIPFYLN